MPCPWTKARWQAERENAGWLADSSKLRQVLSFLKGGSQRITRCLERANVQIGLFLPRGKKASDNEFKRRAGRNTPYGVSNPACDQKIQPTPARFSPNLLHADEFFFFSFRRKRVAGKILGLLGT